MTTTVPGARRGRALVHDRYGQPDEVLRTEDIEVGPPGEGEVLIEVAASSVNPLDWHFTTGTPWMLHLVAGLRAPKERRRGADVAGRVAAVGVGVTELAVGDLVFGGANGAFGEYAITKPANLALKPAELTMNEAAALPIAAATAVQAIDDHAAIQPGQRVLINGAAGGVGTMAVQIAVARGAEVVGVCSTRNVEMVKRLGATTVIDYTATGNSAATTAGTVEALVSEGPFDVILDGVGNWTAKQLKSLLTDDGIVVAHSGPKDNWLLGPFSDMIRKGVAFKFGKGRFAQFTASMGGAMVPVVELVMSGQLRPEIDRTISLDEVPAALTELGKGHVPSKIVVEIAAD